MSTTALVVGGTGPTGPHIVEGLLSRGFEVAVFHRGAHEAELPPVEHIHGDPHFREPFELALQGRDFDLVIAGYGRLKTIADSLRGRCGRFIAIGGNAHIPGCLQPSDATPHGMKVLATESDPLLLVPAEQQQSPSSKFASQVASAELHVIELDRQGAFSATVLRYPFIYGPRQHATSIEATVTAKILTNRPIVLADGGLSIISQCAAQNAAEFVLRAADWPIQAGGEVFNCCDDRQFTQRQWVEMIAHQLGRHAIIISLPDRLALSTRFMFPLSRGAGHAMVDASKARQLLGYRDTIRPEDALASTIEWLVADPSRLPPQEDTEWEDALLTEYEQCLERLAKLLPSASAEVYHPYPHPREPGLVSDHRGR